MGKKPNWELFELESCCYLNTLYSDTQLRFCADGGKNSYSQDIKVYNGQNYIFSIEAKYSPSQSGQFVLKEESGIYLLSKKSKFENNEYTKAIIEHLNNNKEYYSPEGQRAIEIIIEQNILANWIIEHYKSKSSQFIITSTKLGDYKAILPLNDLQEFFNVSAVIRRKKSGTADIPKSMINGCITELKNHLMNFKLDISSVSSLGKKTLIRLPNDIVLKKSERSFGESYYLSENSEGEGYFIKKKSQTNNLNVIFSLKYIGPETNFGIDNLKGYIGRKP